MKLNLRKVVFLFTIKSHAAIALKSYLQNYRFIKQFGNEKR